MTTAIRDYPTRITLKFQGKAGQIALDQIRAIDRERLVRKLGTVPARIGEEVSSVLLEMFAR